MQIASLPLGYNHPELIALASDPRLIVRKIYFPKILILSKILKKTSAVSRPALGAYPRTDFADLIKNSLTAVFCLKNFNKINY
jgi:hypothetical protein